LPHFCPDLVESSCNRGRFPYYDTIIQVPRLPQQPTRFGQSFEDRVNGEGEAYRP
jgi:hypothetical protein